MKANSGNKKKSTKNQSKSSGKESIEIMKTMNGIIGFQKSHLNSPRELRDCIVDVIKISADCPEKKIGVRSSKVYAQIAKTSRNPALHQHTMKLIKAMNDAREISVSNGHITYKRDPAFVPMTVKDIKECFGKDLARMQKTSFIEIKE